MAECLDCALDECDTCAMNDWGDFYRGGCCCGRRSPDAFEYDDVGEAAVKVQRRITLCVECGVPACLHGDRCTDGPVSLPTRSSQDAADDAGRSA